jgi:DNA-binding XRE family transcriptional regulator
MSKNLKLKSAIAETGIKQYELAEQVNVSTQTIQNAINNVPVSMKVAKDICKVLNKSLDELFQ